jgi:hypothetical protein
MQALLACCGVLVRGMGRAEAEAALQGPLMPALVKAFQHNSADVRKAVRPMSTLDAYCMTACVSGQLSDHVAAESSP